MISILIDSYKAFWDALGFMHLHGIVYASWVIFLLGLVLSLVGKIQKSKGKMPNPVVSFIVNLVGRPRGALLDWSDFQTQIDAADQGDLEQAWKSAEYSFSLMRFWAIIPTVIGLLIVTIVTVLDNL